jgi:hypothetical protein
VDAFCKRQGRQGRPAGEFGRAVSPHGSPLISDGGGPPTPAERAMISMQVWGPTAETPAARPGNRSEPTGRDPQGPYYHPAGAPTVPLVVPSARAPRDRQTWRRL